MKGRKDIHGGLKSAAIYGIVMMITLIYIKMIELSKQSSLRRRYYRFYRLLEIQHILYSLQKTKQKSIQGFRNNVFDNGNVNRFKACIEYDIFQLTKKTLIMHVMQQNARTSRCGKYKSSLILKLSTYRLLQLLVNSCAFLSSKLSLF